MRQTSFHTLPDGRSFTENWNEYPLHPQPLTQPLSGGLGFLFSPVPSVFRAGNEVWFVPNPFSDNDAQFGNFGESEYQGTYRIRVNGRAAAGGEFNGFARVKVSQKPSLVSFSLSVNQEPNPLTTLSQGTYTVWTMHTTAQPRAVLPNTWICLTPRFALTQHCTVPSELTLNYQVRDLGLDGVVPAGPQQVSVSVGHIQLGQPSAIVSAKAQVSYDDGLFWSPVSLTRTSPGQYQLSFTPPPGVDVTLKFAASDAAGGSISETITDAYAVGPND